MKLNRIPLKERLERIRSGYAGDEKFNTSVIIRLANIPIGNYLKAFPLECDALMDSLRIEKGTEARQMTYQEVAKRVILSMKKRIRTGLEVAHAKMTVLLMKWEIHSCTTSWWNLLLKYQNLFCE